MFILQWLSTFIYDNVLMVDIFIDSIIIIYYVFRSTYMGYCWRGIRRSNTDYCSDSWSYLLWIEVSNLQT